MQRLFSTFAYGWPGIGLLLQRVLTAMVIVHFGIVHTSETPVFAAVAPQIILGIAGVLLLVGLWTPIAGTIVAVSELWIVFSRASDPWAPLILAALGASLAMIGPGALSLDARLFGRKHIKIPQR